MNDVIPPPLEPEDDQISVGPSSDALLGTVIDYVYSTGRHYRLSFDDDFHVTFELLDHPAPDGFVAPTLTYRAREIRPGLILIHWIVKAPGIHVSITVDLTEKKLHVAAMMPPNRWEFWDTGEILSISRDRP